MKRIILYFIFVVLTAINCRADTIFVVSDSTFSPGEWDDAADASPIDGYTIVNTDSIQAGAGIMAWVKGTSCSASGIGYDCITAENPDVVIVNLGINNALYPASGSTSISQKAMGFVSLFDDLRKDLPDVKLFLMSQYPLHPFYGSTTDAADYNGCSCCELESGTVLYSCAGGKTNCAPKVNNIITKLYSEILNDSRTQRAGVVFLDVRSDILDHYGSIHAVWEDTTSFFSPMTDTIHLNDSTVYYRSYIKPALIKALRGAGNNYENINIGGGTNIR